MSRLEVEALHFIHRFGSVTGSHLYNEAGSYVVEICVTDDDGGMGCDEMMVEVVETAVAPPYQLFLPMITKN